MRPAERQTRPAVERLTPQWRAIWRNVIHTRRKARIRVRVASGIERLECGRELRSESGSPLSDQGSVRKAGNRVRISAPLVSSRDGYQLWSEAFDRGLEDIFAIQEEIAQAVVRSLEVRLSAPREARLTRVGTRDAQAYEMYLRGRKFLMSHGETMLRLARQMFRGAIELDPGFAQAHAGLADADFFMLQWNMDHERAAERRAEALVESEEALRLQPDLAEAHVSRGNVLSLLGHKDESFAGYGILDNMVEYPQNRNGLRRC